MKKETILFGVLFVVVLMSAGFAVADTLIIRPNIQGYYSGWTNSGCGSGLSEWQCVDESPANVSDNLYTNSKNVYESFGFQNTGLMSESINSVTLWFYGKSYSQARYRFQPLIRTSNINYLGAVKSLTSSYAYYNEVYTNNPATGLPWTVAQVDALEAGMKSYNSNYGGRIAQIYAVVDYSPSGSCSDTDGGFVPELFGVVTGYLNENYYNYSDWCISDTTLMEHYCSGNYAYSGNFTCPGNTTVGCLNGVCVQKPQCLDGIDNDANGCSDYPTDSGCSNADDTTESGGTCPDTAPPILSSGTPSGTLPAETNQTNLSLITNEDAECRYSTTTGIPYYDMTYTFVGTSLSHSIIITGLTNGTAYNYYVKCNDTAGNFNTNDYLISFSVASGSEGSSGPVYYIDFQAGNDANNGLTTATAWKHIPGTKNTGNSGWQSSSWGGGNISSTHKVNPGTTFELKAGTTHDSSNGGYILIDSTYYNHGTAATPITIEVSDSWGTGNVVIDGTGISVASYWGLVSIAYRNYITIKGTASNRLVIQDSGERGFQVYGTSSTHQLGAKLAFMDLKSSAGDAGVDFGYADNFEVRNCTASQNNYIGFCVGSVSDYKCNNGTFIDCVADNNGLPGGASGVYHGFVMGGSSNMTYIRCESKNNKRDGFDFGTVSNTNNADAVLIDCISHDNGEDGFSFNGGTGGMRTGYYINCISYNNSKGYGNGGFMAYGGGVTVYYYNCISRGHGSNWCLFDETPGMSLEAHLTNCIGYNASHYQIEVYDIRTTGYTEIYSDHNLWVQGKADNFAGIDTDGSSGRIYVEFPYNGTSKPSSWDASSYPLWLKEDDDNSLWNRNPAFVDILNNNYHIGNSSYCINNGIYLSSPAAAQQDRDGNTRGNPPEIGPYEYL